jgi:hypothetical protein
LENIKEALASDFDFNYVTASECFNSLLLLHWLWSLCSLTVVH